MDWEVKMRGKDELFGMTWGAIMVNIATYIEEGAVTPGAVVFTVIVGLGYLYAEWKSTP